MEFFLYIALILCFFMTFGVGANDLANVMSTSMGSKAITVKQALIIACIFELAGALLGGSEVTETIRDGIIQNTYLQTHPMIMIEGMLSVLLACTIWMNLASYLGVPVSITNALVGSTVGFAAVVLGLHAVQWKQVTTIAIGWVTSPCIAGLTAYFLFMSMQQAIFVNADPVNRAKWYLPIYFFLVGIVLSFITVFKGISHFHIALNLKQHFAITLGTSLAITMLGMFIMHHMPEPHQLRRKDKFMQVERYFAIVMAFTTCAMVFAHGSNDVSLAIGPLSVVYNLVYMNALPENTYPTWIVLFGYIGVLSGFLVYGKKVIETVGSSITALTPSRAFAATFAASVTVVVANHLGIPVSATQTLVGAVLGVGLARGIGALNLIIIRNIFMSWVVTLPIASALSIMAYLGLHAIFHGV